MLNTIIALKLLREEMKEKLISYEVEVSNCKAEMEELDEAIVEAEKDRGMPLFGIEDLYRMSEDASEGYSKANMKAEALQLAISDIQMAIRTLEEEFE